VPVQPAPVGVHDPEDVTAALPGVLEGLGEHLGAAVGADRLEALLEQSHRVETGSRGDVQHLAHTTGLQLVDEEASLALGSTLPVDELVPLLDETGDVLLRVVIGVSNLEWIVTELLLGR